jgi:hypothetical protein
MKNILVLTYFSFKDPLIQTYTLPYVRIVRSIVASEVKIYLFTIEKDVPLFPMEEKKRIKNELALEGIQWIRMRYHPFGLKAIVKWLYMLPYLWWFILKNKIKYLHCWATPAGAAGYILSVLTRQKLIIDSYEPHAEAMVENGTWKRSGIAFKILFFFEKLMSRRAHVVIAATKSMQQYAQKKYNATFNNYLVKPACVNMELFSAKNSKRTVLLKALALEGKIVCVYAGKFGGIYQEHEVFDFFKVAIDFWPEKFKVLLLTNHSDQEIENYCSKSGISSSYIIRKFVPHHEVPDYMGLADFAITPVKPVPTKRHCTPIKNGEYWALGLPIVIPVNISDDSEIIERYNAGAVLRGFTQQDYSAAVKKIEELLTIPREQNFSRIREIAEKHRSFNIAKAVYKRVYTQIFTE